MILYSSPVCFRSSVRTVAIFSFFEAARRFWIERFAMLATFFFSIHPFLFWAGTEIRVYSFVIMLTLILFNVFARIYFSEESQPAWVFVVFVFFAILGLYSNFYIGFLLAGFLAALLISGNFRKSGSYILLMLPVGISFLPLLFATLSTFTTGLDGEVFEVGVLDGIRRVWHIVLSFTLPTELFPPEDQTTISFFPSMAASGTNPVWFGSLSLPTKTPG